MLSSRLLTPMIVALSRITQFLNLESSILQLLPMLVYGPIMDLLIDDPCPMSDGPSIWLRIIEVSVDNLTGLLIWLKRST